MTTRTSSSHDRAAVRRPGSALGARLTTRVATRVALGFVMAAILALVAVPLLGDRYAGPIRDDIRVASESAGRLVTRVHVALALEGSALHDLAETRDPALVGRFRDAVAQERSATRELAPIAARIGPPVTERLADFERLQNEWSTRVSGPLGRGGVALGAVLPPRDQVYDSLLTAAARLDQSLDDAVQLRRERLTAAERMQRVLTIALAVVAILAVSVVGWLGHRLDVFGAEAERRRADLERVLEWRARLARGFSHDLKNPLNAIDGHAELLEEGVRGPLSPPQRESVARIRRLVRSLLALLDDLLELSRVEAGGLPVRALPVAIDEVVRDAAEEHRARAEATGHRLTVAVSGDLPPVYTDPARVRQVLGNLLSNAVKYTPGGGVVAVRAEVRRRDGADGSDWLAVDVADDGPGIPAEKREAIFEEFVRLRPGDGPPGSGLGLSIARRIARVLGGDVTVSSAPGDGATFTLWLPRDRRGDGRAEN